VRTGVPLARPWRLGRLRTGLRWRINDGALLMNLISRTAFGEADNNDLDDALYMNQVLRFCAKNARIGSSTNQSFCFLFGNSMVSTASEHDDFCAFV